MRALAVLALPVIAIAIGLIASQRAKLAKHGRLLSRPERRIDDVLDGEIVAIAGTIVAIEGETIEAPLTGKPAVWVRSEARSLQTIHHREIAHVDFLVDDGSATRARVRPAGALVAVKEKWVGFLRDARPPSKFLRPALAVPPRPGPRGAIIDYVEAALSPADDVYVVGRARVTRPAGYRGETSKEVVFSHDSDEGHSELSIGSSKGAIAAGLRRWFLVGLLLLALGIGMLALGASGWAGLA